jgi:hypothetical protein
MNARQQFADQTDDRLPYGYREWGIWRSVSFFVFDGPRSWDNYLLVSFFFPLRCFSISHSANWRHEDFLRNYALNKVGANCGGGPCKYTILYSVVAAVRWRFAIMFLDARAQSSI